MSTLILVTVIGVVGLLVVPGLAAAFYRFLENDGYGRPRGETPRSHHRDLFDPRSGRLA
jgi:hypothetical protein